jgi:CheY-like chemotaxis protein
LTDTVKRTLTADHHQTTRDSANERLPAPRTALTRANPTRPADAAAHPSTPAHTQTAAAGCSMNRDGEAAWQVAPLATREDEAGATGFVERAVVVTLPLIQSRDPASSWTSRPRSPRGSESGPRRAMPRTLIVDGDRDAADSLAALLQSTGYGDARVAYTGATALALAVEFLPTLLLVDLDLPDISGYDVARKLSQHPQLQGLRLIAMTAGSEHPGRELAREAGIERYLSKPVSSTALDALFT